MEAIESHERALGLTNQEPERRFIERRLRDVRAGRLTRDPEQPLH